MFILVCVSQNFVWTYLVYCTRKSFQTAILGNVGTGVSSGTRTLLLYIVALLFNTLVERVYTFPHSVRI
jgi:hypothetical protein